MGNEQSLQLQPTREFDPHRGASSSNSPSSISKLQHHTSHHHPHHPQKVPIRSALKRSLSSGGTGTTSNSSSIADDSSSSPSSTTRYIPKMTARSDGNGLIMPTRPYPSHHYQDSSTASAGNPSMTSNGASVTSGGVESPQWGWYTNLTPPTPDMYQSHHHPSRKAASSSTAPPLPEIKSQQCLPDGAVSMPQQQHHQPNQVFQNLQSKNQPMSWSTSVPI